MKNKIITFQVIQDYLEKIRDDIDSIADERLKASRLLQSLLFLRIKYYVLAFFSIIALFIVLFKANTFVSFLFNLKLIILNDDSAVSQIAIPDSFSRGVVTVIFFFVVTFSVFYFLSKWKFKKTDSFIDEMFIAGIRSNKDSLELKTAEEHKRELIGFIYLLLF